LPKISHYENTSGMFTAMIECGEPRYSYKWERSTNGLNWATVGTGYTYNYYQPPGMNGNFSFTIRLTVTDDGNTIVTSHQTIMAVDPYNSDFQCAPVDGGDPTLLKSFTVYPNPTSTSQRLSLVFDENSKKKPIQINLIDQNGRALQTKELKQATSYEEQFTLGQTFSSGLFYMQVYFDDGSSESQTILIK
jgi:hypothetical protein